MQQSDLGVQGASPDITTTAEQIRSLVDQQLTTSLQKMLPSLLKEALKTSENFSTTEQVKNSSIETKEKPSNFKRLKRCYNTTKESILPDEVLEVIKTAFSKQLSKDIWSDLMEKYPPIKGSEEILVAPIMETGTKEYMCQKFVHHKTKDVLAFD